MTVTNQLLIAICVCLAALTIAKIGDQTSSREMKTFSFGVLVGGFIIGLVVLITAVLRAA